MTILVQKRWRFYVSALLLGGLCAIIAVGGIPNSPIVSVVFGALALAFLGYIVVDRRRPARFLSISVDEIAFGRLEEPGLVITRDVGDRLQVKPGYRGMPFLVSSSANKPAIALTGFDPNDVRRACEAHGWTFVDG